jgi:hypothetical protein
MLPRSCPISQKVILNKLHTTDTCFGLPSALPCQTGRSILHPMQTPYHVPSALVSVLFLYMIRF